MTTQLNCRLLEAMLRNESCIQQHVNTYVTQHTEGQGITATVVHQTNTRQDTTSFHPQSQYASVLHAFPVKSREGERCVLFRGAKAAEKYGQVGAANIDCPLGYSLAFSTTQGKRKRFRARIWLRHLSLAATSAFHSSSKW